MKTPVRKRNEAGFTIIELLISTMVFGVVLLVIASAIIQISRIYYKGLTEAKTQTVARTIADLISQGIQFNGGDVTTTNATPTAGNSYAFCVGDQQYSYTLGYQLADAPTASQTYHALVINNVAGCTSASPAQNVRVAAVSGRELLAPKMRLANLQVTDMGANLYRVTVKVVYGDDDLLNNPNSNSSACKAVRAGTQFCAVSELSTVVTKRVN